MFKINLKNLIPLVLIFVISHAQAGFQEQYNSVTTARNTTIQTFHEIEVYTDSLQDKFNFFKANCRSKVDTNNLLPCLGANIFINARLERVQVLLSFLRDYVQSYPNDLAALKPGLENKIKNLESLVLITKNKISTKSFEFENKSREAFKSSTQKSIANGILLGDSHYYCTSFHNKIDLFDLAFAVLKKKNSKFSDYYKKYDEVAQFVANAEFFRSECPSQIEFGKSALVLQKFLAEITIEKTINYIKSQCSQLKDQDVKEKCRQPGEKKADLLYTLFAVEQVK